MSAPSSATSMVSVGPDKNVPAASGLLPAPDGRESGNCSDGGVVIRMMTVDFDDFAVAFVSGLGLLP